jgi:hypothetical protein
MSFGRRPAEPGTLQGVTRSETGNIDWTFDNQATLPATQVVLRTSQGPFLRFSTINNGTIYFGPTDNPYTISNYSGKLTFGFASGIDQFNLNFSRIELYTSIVANGELEVGYCFKQNQYTETIDLRLLRDAAGTLAQRNGTNAQTYRLYETYTDSSNGAWLGFRAANTRYEISGQSNGTGTTREVALPLGLELDARTAPSAPANNRSRIYAESAGGGLTKIMARFPTGSAQQIAIEGGVATIPIAAPKLDPAYYYFPPFTDNNGASTAATAGRMWVFPYFFQRPTTFNRIGFRTHGTHTASVNVRLGLFNDRTSQTSNGPGTLIYDSGDMATVGVDTDHVATINQTLFGTVWIAFMASGATASFQVAGYFRPEFNLLFGLSDNQGYGLSGTAPFRDRTYGAYGDESGNTFSQANLGAPCPFLRAV